ncbi:pentatricopeptide repeat-containing protein At5g38730 [Lotus japonicus]|uniref:pentatricopeptide repeat-containing protein At5g38730 n=1 Tax=Lotus japonicus TaxID=34305 RepID=UPI00258275FB|nr:pentatricopeptide repeat-containing protein At5g38730 [Lotus japonicus]
MVLIENQRQFIDGVCAIIVKGHWGNLLKVNNAPVLSSTTIHQVLLQLSLNGYGPSISFPFFKWVESTPHYTHSLQCSWAMIQILAKYKHFKTAQQMLDKIAHRDFLSSPSVLSSLVRIHDDPEVNSQVLSWLVIHYAKSRMTQDALQVFEQMRLYQLKPHLPACTVLLSSLLKDGTTNVVWKIHKRLVQDGVVLNIYIYNCLIHACSKSRDVERAKQLLNEMEEKGVVPDIFTYNTLISLYCKKGMHYEALSIQDKMEREGINLDIVSYNSLIYGFCKEGRMREATRMFSEIKDATPNHVTYTTLIDGYCKANELDQALKVRELMEAKGLYPGVATYNSILRKLCQDGRIRDANKLLNEMSEKKVQADNITCNTLINAYSKIGDLKSALKFKNKMLESGLKPDPFTYKALIHGFCKMDELESAKELLFGMLDAGFTPSYCSYSWIVDGYCKKDNVDAILALPDEFLSKGLCLDASVYRALIRRLCKIEQIECAEKLFYHMEGNGISGDSVIYTSLAYAYWKSGKTSVASNVLEEMAKRRLIITAKIYSCFSVPDGHGENKVSQMFWDHVVERGLMSRNTMRKIQQMLI